VRTCGQCGATSPDEAAWCGQCYLPFARVPEPAYAGAAPDPGHRSGHELAPPLWPPAVAGSTVAATSIPLPMPADLGAGGDGRLLDRRAVGVVAIAIGLGGAMQLIALGLAHVSSIEPATLIRYDIVLTIGLYAVVAALLVSQITPSVRPRWGGGALAIRIGIGLGWGVAISALLLGLVSAVAGHAQTDPRLVLMMSEGDPTHIVVTIFLACVAAPLVEETLFRGLLLESLRPRGPRMAIGVSALAFAVWHFMPASLVYYAALGAALGTLYVRRGLACSIAAHVGFNGVLAVAAIFIVLGPSRVVTVGELSVRIPGGWSTETAAQAALPPGERMLTGPSGAQLEIVPGSVASGPVSAAGVAARLTDDSLSLPAGLVFDAMTVTQRTVPAGEVVEVPFTTQGVGGTVALIVVSGRSYELVFIGGGSEKAARDFTQVVDSLRPA
jgi:membrane protease YdiL (CAAX protease family)